MTLWPSNLHLDSGDLFFPAFFIKVYINSSGIRRNKYMLCKYLRDRSLFMEGGMVDKMGDLVFYESLKRRVLK